MVPVLLFVCDMSIMCMISDRLLHVFFIVLTYVLMCRMLCVMSMVESSKAIVL